MLRKVLHVLLTVNCSRDKQTVIVITFPIFQSALNALLDARSKQSILLNIAVCLYTKESNKIKLEYVFSKLRYFGCLVVRILSI